MIDGPQKVAMHALFFVCLLEGYKSAVWRLAGVPKNQADKRDRIEVEIAMRRAHLERICKLCETRQSSPVWMARQNDNFGVLSYVI